METLAGAILKPVLNAEMSISAIQLIVLDMIDEWDVDALPVLAGAADDYMTLVEDEFFVHAASSDAELDHVGIEDARREFGL